MTRRYLLACMADAAAAACLAGTTSQTSGKQGRRRFRFDPSDKRNRIGVSTWSFRSYFQATRERDSNLAGSALVLLDFPEMIADRYGVHNLEFVAPHFASKEPTYIQEIKLKLQNAHSRLVNIPVDIPEIGMRVACPIRARASAMRPLLARRIGLISPKTWARHRCAVIRGGLMQKI